MKYGIYLYGDWGLGIGDWGLGIGDWAQSPIPNPQSPIPIFIYSLYKFYSIIIILKLNKSIIHIIKHLKIQNIFQKNL